MSPLRLLEYVTCLLAEFSIFLISSFTLPISASSEPKFRSNSSHRRIRPCYRQAQTKEDKVQASLSRISQLGLRSPKKTRKKTKKFRAFRTVTNHTKVNSGLQSGIVPFLVAAGRILLFPRALATRHKIHSRNDLGKPDQRACASTGARLN